MCSFKNLPPRIMRWAHQQPLAARVILEGVGLVGRGYATPGAMLDPDFSRMEMLVELEDLNELPLKESVDRNTAGLLFRVVDCRPGEGAAAAVAAGGATAGGGGAPRKRGRPPAKA